MRCLSDAEPSFGLNAEPNSEPNSEPNTDPNVGCDAKIFHELFFILIQKRFIIQTLSTQIRAFRLRRFLLILQRIFHFDAHNGCDSQTTSLRPRIH